MLTRLTDWARVLRADVLTLYLAARDPRVPWHAKALAALVAAYALSPIDLVPDFIPVLGLLDDLVLVPVGVFLVIKLTPQDVLADLRRQAEAQIAEPGANWWGAALVVLFWLLVVALLVWLFVPGFRYTPPQGVNA
ncbi:MAG: YkvA family protein [Hyphomonadaceae bacterium]